MIAPSIRTLREFLTREFLPRQLGIAPQSIKLWHTVVNRFGPDKPLDELTDASVIQHLTDFFGAKTFPGHGEQPATAAVAILESCGRLRLLRSSAEANSEGQRANSGPGGVDHRGILPNPCHLPIAQSGTQAGVAGGLVGKRLVGCLLDGGENREFAPGHDRRLGRNTEGAAGKGRGGENPQGDAIRVAAGSGKPYRLRAHRRAQSDYALALAVPPDVALSPGQVDRRPGWRALPQGRKPAVIPQGSAYLSVVLLGRRSLHRPTAGRPLVACVDAATLRRPADRGHSHGSRRAAGTTLLGIFARRRSLGACGGLRALTAPRTSLVFTEEIMLVLSRQEAQSLTIETTSGTLRISVQEIRRGKVRLGFEGPQEFVIVRDEAMRKNSVHRLDGAD